MIRSTLLYRRLWYAKQRNAKRIHIYSRIVTLLFILAMLMNYVQKNIMEYMADYYEPAMKSRVEALVTDLISTRFAKDLKYDNITSIAHSKGGKILSIETKNSVLNPISLHIASIVEEEFRKTDGKKLPVAFGKLIGSSLLNDIGPFLLIDIYRHGHTEVDFRSEFIKESVEVTRHRIVVQVKTTIGINAPFLWKKQQLVVEVPVAEAVLTYGAFLN